MALVLFILQGLRLLVFADVLLSWLVRDPAQFPRNITTQITAPLYAPIRAILNPQKTGGFDLAPLIILIGLSLLQRALR